MDNKGDRSMVRGIEGFIVVCVVVVILILILEALK